PAAVVGGSDSIRPSSCCADDVLRISESRETDAPVTLTTSETGSEGSTCERRTLESTPAPVNFSSTSPFGTPLRVKRSAASTPDEIVVPTTETTRPGIAAPLLAASRGEPARTVPLMIAVAPPPPVVEGLVGDFDAPLHADTTSAASRLTEKLTHLGIAAPDVAFAGDRE